MSKRADRWAEAAAEQIRKTEETRAQALEQLRSTFSQDQMGTPEADQMADYLVMTALKVITKAADSDERAGRVRWYRWWRGALAELLKRESSWPR